MPIPQFLERKGEVAAIVAADFDGRVLGHVSVCRVLDPPADPAEKDLGPKWAAAHGCGIDELRVIGVLFADPDMSGQGVGSALMAAATQEAQKGKPVLDCLSTNTTALNFYLRRGWSIIGEWRDAPWLPGERILVHLLILPSASEDS
jgi:GNAT superfamily N-acetyltransferase